MRAGAGGCHREEAQQAPAAASSAAAAPQAAASTPSGPVITPVAYAQPTDAQRSEGAALAAKGAGAVTACVACHGAQGEGNAGSGFPRIAGQSYTYLLHELESYGSGTRKHPVMQPLAAAMTAQQRADVAAYYASITPSAAAGAPAPSASTSAGGRGRQLAEVGDESKGVQSCANCHGPGGIGAGELYPFLAGQHANYLANALGAWRDGSRNDDPSGQMPMIAKALTPEEVQALAAYYAAQPLRTTTIDSETMRVAPSNVAALQTGPTQATQQPSATGGSTEQGAALSGGEQGPGGGGGTSPASTGAPQSTTR